MAITPADIQAQCFSEDKHGYNTNEVDAFLEQICVEVDSMLAKIVDLKNRLSATEQQLAASQQQLAAAQQQASEVVPAPAVPDFSATERQISAALISAQQTAEAIVSDARDNADRIRTDADEKAREVIRQALAEKQNEIEEIDRLKASREEFRAEYVKLIQHFMDDAQATFPPNLLSSTPSGMVAEPAVAPSMPAPAAQAVVENVAAQEPVAVADPFAPLADFDLDDLD